MEIQIEEPTVPQASEEPVVFIDESENPTTNGQTSQNEKNADTMELEEEPSTTAQQTNPSTESADVAFFQTQKLPSYKEEMKKLLGEGLQAFTIKPLSQERIAELLGKVEADAGSEANKDIIMRLLAEKVESSRESQAELAKKSKEYIDSLSAHFNGLDENFYMDLICNNASFKAYLDLKINYLDDFMLNLNEYSVWEIKKNEFLEEITIKDQMKVVKEQRKWKIKALTALDKLIKGIQKLKTPGEITKVWTLKNKYDDVIQSKKPDYVEKPPKAQKRKHKQLDEPTPAEISEIEEEALGSLKKLKLTSAKTTVDKDSITPVKTKVTVSKSTAKKNVSQTPAKASSMLSGETPSTTSGNELTTPEDPKKAGAKTPVKKEVEKKDNNQKNLMSFFTKKPVQAEAEKPKVEKKEMIAEQQVVSRFKCLGSLKVRSEWDACRAEAFEKLFGESECEKPSTEELLAAAKEHHHILNTQKEVRKIFISIHDSFKRIKGRFDGASTKIGGQDPLFRDEALINYDMDSEDEMQEFNAENIDEDHPSDNESDGDEGDEEDFIVPDGYVSAEEIANDSDNEGDEKDRAEIRQSMKMAKDDPGFKDRPKILSLILNDYEIGKDAQLDVYLQDFTIIKLIDDEYPIRTKRGKENLQNTGKAKLNPEAINDDEIVKELLFSLHGEFGKPDTIKKNQYQVPSMFKEFN